MNVAIIGAGWAGLAAAVRATQAGHAVTLFDMAHRPGGRARSDSDIDGARDNGQHILLGGYGRTLALMRDVGVDPGSAFSRTPLCIRWADGTGFALRGRGPRLLDVAGALLRASGFGIADKLALARTVRAWRRARFDCDASLTVQRLLEATTTATLRRRLLEPLCVAALNTPVQEASARVFLAVLRDSLFGERHAADLLVPRVPLGHLLPMPAQSWLAAAGADVRLGERVTALEADAGRWRLRTRRIVDPSDGDVRDAVTPPPGGVPDSRTEVFEGVIVACTAPEAARLCAPHAPAWSSTAAALEHEPIATVWLRIPHRRWPSTMLALDSDPVRRPAQFAFRLPPPRPGAMGLDDATAHDDVTLVTSAAAAWVQRGLPELRQAAVAQVREALGLASVEPVECLHARIDKRATFRCVAGVSRPPARVAERLVAAGDYIDGPYPATLEAAVRSGEAAVTALSTSLRDLTA